MKFEDSDRVFFPLIGIQTQDVARTISLFNWCDKNGIEIVHSVQMLVPAAGHVLSPNGKPNLIPSILYYGACDNQAHFRECFGFNYSFSPNFLSEIGRIIDSETALPDFPSQGDKTDV